MKKLGEKILELRNQGKSYNEIVKILNCSKANVSYHCGKGQKEKTRERTKKRRKKTVISKRVENFQKDRRLRDKTEDFQRERIKIDGVGTRRGKRNITFRWHDVIEKYGWETTCYLTGRPINLKEIETYEFDHIIPYSKNGSCTIENLGIASKEANRAKYNMNLPDFLNLCKEILEHHKYKVELTEDNRSSLGT